MTSIAISTDIEQRESHVLAAFVTALGVLLIGCLVVDVELSAVSVKFEQAHRAALRDWMKLGRAFGSAVVWLSVALAAWLVERDERRRRAANPSERDWSRTLALSVITSGVLAELLKLAFRRKRPSASDGWYDVRAFSDRALESSGLSLPSSDAAVAFAAAFTLYRSYPAAWPVWLVFAIAASTERVLQGQHFASDVLAGGVVGALTAHFVGRALDRRRRNRSRTVSAAS